MTTLREIHWDVFHGDLPFHMAVELSGDGLTRLWNTATDDDAHLMAELVVETGGVLPVSLGLDLAEMAADIVGLTRQDSWRAFLEQGRRTARTRRRTEAFESVHHNAALELDNTPGSVEWGGWNAVVAALGAVDDMLNGENALDISKQIVDVSFFARGALVAYFHPQHVSAQGLLTIPPGPDPDLTGTSLARAVAAVMRAPTLDSLVAAASANAIGQGRMT